VPNTIDPATFFIPHFQVELWEKTIKPVIRRWELVAPSLSYLLLLALRSATQCRTHIVNKDWYVFFHLALGF